MKYIRLVVYLCAFLFGGTVLFLPYVFRQLGVYFGGFFLDGIGLLALVFLYGSLLPSPLYEVFPALPGKLLFQRAKKALGISAFFFALVYLSCLFLAIAYGLSVPPSEWGMKVIARFVIEVGAVFILGVLAITSIKAIKQRIRPWWKTLHRSVYLAGSLAVVDVALLASERKLNIAFLVVSYLLIEFLLFIQLIRFDRFFRARYPTVSRSIVSMGFPFASLLLFWAFFLT